MGKTKMSKARSEELFAQGQFLCEVIRDTPEGPRVIQRITAPNLVVNSGKKQLFRIGSGLTTALKFKFGRCGINSAAAGSADTNVKTAITGTLHTCDVITMSGRTFQLVWSYASGAGTKSANFKEIAILSQKTSPGASCLARALLSPVAAKTTADKLKLTYTCRIT